MKVFNQLFLTTCVSFFFTTNAQTTSNPWKIFHYTCEKTFYSCGLTPIDPSTSCKTSQNITTIGKMNTTQCLKLNNLTRLEGPAVFKQRCPNGKLVSSYAKYKKVGSLAKDGKLCTKKNGCLCCRGADGFGDPHFVTYDGTPYSFHGQCDLVMSKSPEFANGLGLYVHGRTQIIEDSWSLISNAAVKIGEDVLELTNTGILYFNGEVVGDDELPSSMAGVYNVTRQVKLLNDIPKIDVSVFLNEGKSKVKFSLFKRLIAVHVGEAVEDTNGMLGNRRIDGLVGRDDIILTNPNDMGLHWQVTNDEPMIFKDNTVAPQYPERCVLPKVDSRNRKLRSSPVHRRRAEESCAGVTGDKLQFCIEDILLTGDHEIGMMYGDAF